MFAEVAIPRGAPAPLTYAIPDELAPLVTPGVRVRVGLRRRVVVGVVVGLSQTSAVEAGRVRPIEQVLDLEPLVPPHLLELADFVAGYYRAPLGDTLAAILPAPLLRRDAEQAEPSLAGVRAALDGLPPRQREMLAALRDAGRLAVPTLVARCGARDRAPLDALVEAGLVRLRRRLRARPPKVEVTALALAERPLEELLEACRRAPRRREVVAWLAERGGPTLATEVEAATGASRSTLRAMVEAGLLVRFTQLPARPQRWALRADEGRLTLTDEQAAAVATVIAAVEARRFAPFLLDGITGSGKTEVYLRCLEAAVASGRGGIVLVPEIGLTPAAVGAVRRRFGERVALLHSALSEGERWQQWLAVRDGGARVVVGPRSALFAPLERPGLVIVDEEQDPAYKQQEAPRYQARDLALVLGQRLATPVLLCSATPSAEAAALVERGLATRLRLTRRVAGGRLPEVELVDLRREPPEPGEQGRTYFSRRLRAAITETVGRGEQVILLIQRRGWAPILLCRDCGHRLECADCSVALVVHRRSGDLRCHYCGASRPVPARCPACSGTLLEAIGAGTEKIASLLGRLVPGVSTVILDRDTVRRRAGLEESLGAFASGAAQILVGTQMVAKGHHFPAVTLTGVISADAQLGLPDFRAGERTFQLLTQLAGRAGRGERPGRVIIQTYYPDHPAVRHASSHDVGAFLREELLFRRAFAYPPATRMALLRFESPHPGRVRQAAEEAEAAVDPPPPDVRLRGPAPAPLERLRGRWRWQVMVSAPNRELLRVVVAQMEAVALPSGVHRVVDVDPLSTL